jgi:hypothetical protein
LARRQVSLPYPFEEGGVLPQFPTVELVRVQNANRKAEFLGDDPDRLRQVGIVRDEDSSARMRSHAVQQLRLFTTQSALLYASTSLACFEIV